MTHITGLAADEDISTTVVGDPKRARNIAKQSIGAIRRFSKAVFKGDIETAYGLCANELRAWMGVKRFVAALDQADSRFGGQAVDVAIEYVGWIYADEQSRARSPMDGWPKDTPKANRRATICTFWFTDKRDRRGRWVFFFVTEEAEGYRIAKFHQYLQ